MDAAIRIRPDVSTVAAPDGPLTIAEIALGGVPRGAVLVLCDDGRLGHVAGDVLNGLAEHGYVSVAAEPRTSSPSRGVADVLALRDRLHRQGWTDQQIGVVGYGTGAEAALAAATVIAAAAVVGLAATPVLPPGPAPALRAPWLGMYARRGGQWGQLRRFLAAQPVHSRVLTYSDAADTFYRVPGRPRDRAAAFEAWQRTVEWLNLRVAPTPTPLARQWESRRNAGDTRTGPMGDS